MAYGLVIISLDEENDARNLLRSEMAKRNISIQQLTDLLNKKGIVITKAGVANKISRGRFSADFFLSSLKVIGCEELGIVLKK